MIEIRNLVKKYSGATTNAVDGLDLTIGKGELFGLLGPNGAGKTTTISILSGLLSPTSGTVRVAGLDVEKRAGEVKRRIGVVPQDIALYPALTARENLLFFGRLYRLSGAALRTRAGEALERVGLSDRADERVDTYSGGMKRRVNIAAGLMHRPDVLLLDEPTVGVDPQSRNFILDGVAALAKEGLTVVYSTHYMEEVERLCSRIAILDRGRVLETDSPRALVERHGGEPVVEVRLPSLESVFLHLTGKRLRDQEA